MKTSTLLIGAGIAGILGYFLYKKYKDQQRAAAHPISIAPDSRLLKTLPINPNLVSDAHLVM